MWKIQVLCKIYICSLAGQTTCTNITSPITIDRSIGLRSQQVFAHLCCVANAIMGIKPCCVKKISCHIDKLVFTNLTYEKIWISSILQSENAGFTFKCRILSWFTSTVRFFLDLLLRSEIFLFTCMVRDFSDLLLRFKIKHKNSNNFILW